jgi:hypothetical protein
MYKYLKLQIKQLGNFTIHILQIITHFKFYTKQQFKNSFCEKDSKYLN